MCVVALAAAGCAGVCAADAGGGAAVGGREYGELRKYLKAASASSAAASLSECCVPSSMACVAAQFEVLAGRSTHDTTMPSKT